MKGKMDQQCSSQNMKLQGCCYTVWWGTVILDWACLPGLHMRRKAYQLDFGVMLQSSK